MTMLWYKSWLETRWRFLIGLALILCSAPGVIPALLIPLLSPAIGQHYAITSILIHGICLFIAVSVFFGLAFLLSAVFNDMWRPLLIALALAVILSIIDQLYGIPGYSI